MQRLFAQASLPRQFFEGDFGVNQVAEHGKPLGGFAFKQRAHGFGVERPREFAVALDARHDGFLVVSCQCHFHGFTFKPSLAAAFRWRSSKLKNTFACKTRAAATCNRSKLRVPNVGV